MTYLLNIGEKKVPYGLGISDHPSGFGKKIEFAMVYPTKEELLPGQAGIIEAGIRERHKNPNLTVHIGNSI